MSQVLQFEAWRALIDVSFWRELGKKKLYEYQLSEEVVPLCSYYASGSGRQELSSMFSLDAESFDPEGSGAPPFSFLLRTELHNTNLIESFRSFNCPEALNACGQRVWDAITTRKFFEDPSLLNPVILVTHADLKSHKVYFRAAAPVLLPAEQFSLLGSAAATDQFDASQLESIRSQVRQLPAFSSSAFLITLPKKTDTSSCPVLVSPLSQWSALRADLSIRLLVGFADPSTRSDTPGWTLRNLLMGLLVSGVEDRLDVFCYRDAPAVPDATKGLAASQVLSVGVGSNVPTVCPELLGWLKFASSGKGGAPSSVGMADISHLMDPVKLAASAASLNIALMRWRMIPSLDTERLSALRVLLVGSGTLGCHVARNLLMWGIHRITFLDCGKVSFSNPVRQTLFEYADCLDGGKPKALAAAEALKRILPTADAVGVNLTVPMPGHPIADQMLASTEEDVKHLEELIKSHDAIYILTDSRESRWLPSVIASAHHKLVINAALGFDTYVVMRHGMGDAPANTGAHPDHSPGGALLGCYFCNDIVAPTDSMTDRTLDQACTVTRPGVSSLAASLSVELLVALLHHPLGALAPAPDPSARGPYYQTDEEESSVSSAEEGTLGLVPHHIRGAIFSYSTTLMAGVRASRCSACGEAVVQAYRQQGFQFLKSVFNDSEVLNNITGVSAMIAEMGDEAEEADDDF